jgi:hypothetical protein
MYRPARSFALPKIKIARFDPQAYLNGNRFGLVVGRKASDAFNHRPVI